VSDARQSLNVDNVELGIPQGFGVDGPGFAVDGRSQTVKVVGIDKADVDAEAGQRVVEKVLGASI
jgi:hypothetical protein